MKYVGMTGHCECLSTSDADGRPGQLLILHTHQVIPYEERESLQLYFRRKLTDLGEVGSMPLLVVVNDGNDLSRSLQQQQHPQASSARIASIIAGANAVSPQVQLVEEQLYERREQIAASRRQRFEDSGGEAENAAPYAPMRVTPMTDLGGL
ncbi:MAG: hypothetical protein LBQ32_00605 [Burkholderiaceae bacterium]|nr:hypothetical protein [Burkholderiaceae bacterium]